jgi:hypothetical protein
MKRWVIFCTVTFLVSFFAIAVLSQHKANPQLKQERAEAGAAILKIKKEAVGSAQGAVVLDLNREAVSGAFQRTRLTGAGQMTAVEPNNSARQANLIEFSSGGGEKSLEPEVGGPDGTLKTFRVTGTFSGTDDVDYFCVACNPGEFMTFDVDSEKKGAPTDVVLTVFDLNGNIVATRDDGRGLSGDSLDPCINLACPTGGGKFFVQLKNRGWIGASIDPLHGDLSYILTVGLDTRGEMEPNDYFAGDELTPCCGHVASATQEQEPIPSDEDEEGDGEVIGPCGFGGADEDEDEDGDGVAVTYGTINPDGDIDCYVICLDIGDVLRIDIDGGECNSFGRIVDAGGNTLFNDTEVFDPWIELISPTGLQVAESDDVQDVDPGFLYTASERGPYVICVHSLWDNGAPDYVYRLTCTIRANNEVETNDTVGTAQDINCTAPSEDEDEEPDEGPEPTPPPGGCEVGKPRVLTWEYTGQDCSFSNNTQARGKWSCADWLPLLDPVYIVAQNQPPSGNPHNTKIWFSGIVYLGQTFDMDATLAGETRLGTQTYVYIYDLEVPHNLLQTLSIHTSCSQPLVVGDQFGSLILRDFVPDI